MAKKPKLETNGLRISEEEWNAICIGKTCSADYNGTKCPIYKSCMSAIKVFNDKPLQEMAGNASNCENLTKESK